MKRRKFLQTTSAAAGSAAALGSPSVFGQKTGEKKPNLLIIHCDELNFRTLGCYRDTLPPEQALMWGPDAVCETPHIDSIAKNGALCTKFYAATPVCSPSRSSFITGRYPQNTPMVNNNVPLDGGVTTFAHLLGQAGYATGYAGKWHLDGGGKPQWEPERSFGFDDNRFMFNRGHWKQFEFSPEGEPRIKARDKNGKPSYSVQGADEKSFATDWLTDRTIEFIAGEEEGRKLDALFRKGNYDFGLENVTFMRSTGKTGGNGGWLAAVSPTHKLILSDRDDPWLLDLEKDPDELVNVIDDADQAESLKQLAMALDAYAKRTRDPYARHPRTGAALERLSG